MRFRYRLQTLTHFISFAFYPKVTIFACLTTATVINAFFGYILHNITQGSVAYDIVLALLTGVTASFIVAIIVELANNYRHNKLSWHELHEYYSTVVKYEMRKQVYMQNTPSQRAEEKARKEAGITQDPEDQPMDIIQATWEQLPKIMPVLKETLENKKAFLTDKEINELKNIVLADYNAIWREIHKILMMSPILHNALNTPDERSIVYPQNIIDDMPGWLRKHIASNVSLRAIESITDEIMSDMHLLTEFMSEYDISQSSIDNYESIFDEEAEAKDEELNYDSYDFSEPDNEEEFRARLDKQDKLLKETNKPFVAWYISQSCSNISESMDILEQEIIKKPYYGILLKHERQMQKASLDNEISEMSYEYEKNRL